jgi:hypothetical protein
MWLMQQPEEKEEDLGLQLARRRDISTWRVDK